MQKVESYKQFTDKAYERQSRREHFILNQAIDEKLQKTNITVIIVSRLCFKSAK